MKIQLLMTGKTDSLPLNEILNDYASRVNHYFPFEIEILPNIKNTKNLTEKEQKKLESSLIIKSIQAGDYFIALDENGKEMTSSNFAAFLEKKMQLTYKRLVFVIGGPYGFSEDVYKIANERIALSRMTFPHQLIRIIFTEQLYRAATIIKGERYHHI